MKVKHPSDEFSVPGGFCEPYHETFGEEYVIAKRAIPISFWFYKLSMKALRYVSIIC